MQRIFAVGLLLAWSWCSTTCAAPISKLYVFGDSLSDNGNVLRLTTSGAIFDSDLVPRPKTPWYSEGRWTNGKDNTGSTTTDPKTTQSAYEGVWHEQLATKLGLDLAKPYLENVSNANLAFGGATTAAGVVDNIPYVGGQLDLFFGQSPTITATQLFLTWAGGNDLRDAAKADGATKNSIKTAATTALDNMKAHITRLADAGARHFIWPNLPPLHLVPEFLSADATIRDGLKEAAEKFRDDQAAAVAMIRDNHADTEITVVDIYGLFLKVAENPGAFGYTNVTQGIIDVPSFSAKAFAPTANFTTQQDPDKFMFWDQLHPTARTHALIAMKVRSLIPEPSTLVLLVVLGVACSQIRTKAERQ